MAGALCVSVQMVVDAEHARRSLGARGRALREEAVVLRAADKAEGRHARDAVSRPDGNGRRVGKAQLSGVERLAALLHKAVENDAHLLARDERLGATDRSIADAEFERQLAATLAMDPVERVKRLETMSEQLEKDLENLS